MNFREFRFLWHCLMFFRVFGICYDFFLDFLRFFLDSGLFFGFFLVFEIILSFFLDFFQKLQICWKKVIFFFRNFQRNLILKDKKGFFFIWKIHFFWKKTVFFWKNNIFQKFWFVEKKLLWDLLKTFLMFSRFFVLTYDFLDFFLHILFKKKKKMFIIFEMSFFLDFFLWDFLDYFWSNQGYL